MKAKKYLSIILAAAMTVAVDPATVPAEAVSDETVESAAGNLSSLDEPSDLDAEDGSWSVDDDETDEEMTDDEKQRRELIAWYDDFSDNLDETLGEMTVIHEGDPVVTTNTYPCFLNSADVQFDLPLYFVNDVNDLPYIEMNDLCELLVTVYQSLAGDMGYNLQMEADGPVVEITRDNDYSMVVDFDKDTLSFDDYDAFIHKSIDTYLLESVSTLAFDGDGNELLLKRNEKGSYDRYGKEIEIDLDDYDISLYRLEDEDLYLVPLQTIGDFLVALPCRIDVSFNGNIVFLANKGAIRTPEGLTKLGYAYACGPTWPMSEELAWFNYCELCLVMDKLYGLKEQHGIASFDELFEEIGYKDKLTSTNTNIFDGALDDFIRYYLDDMHSGVALNSFRSDEVESLNGEGISMKQIIADDDKFREARNNAKRPIVTYEEVGNTAYITFDYFNLMKTVQQYYTQDHILNPDPSDPNIDTFDLIFYAHEQITRENSPIENVVLDMSLNGGGAVDAAAVVAAWLLGEAEISIQSTLTGAHSTSVYQADINLDGNYDENDTVADKNLYCLISPVSFSCGNLVPSILKNSHKVTLLGQTSGGGSCSVLGLTSAGGSFFDISSPYDLANVKNGSYYSINNGVEPDYYIDKPANMYDRDALTAYINNLF